MSGALAAVPDAVSCSIVLAKSRAFRVGVEPNTFWPPLAISPIAVSIPVTSPLSVVSMICTMPTCLSKLP